LEVKVTRHLQQLHQPLYDGRQHREECGEVP